MDLLQYYKTDDRIIKLAGALSDYKAARIHLKGLIGSSDAMVALALYNIQKQGNLFVLPDREEAIYFQNDLENISGHRVLFFPSSYKKPFDITQLDTSAVLQRAEVLNELKYNTANGKLIVSYPEAIAEKVVDQQVLAANTLEINLAEKISIETINEFLYDFDFERVDFVYEAGQFAIRGGIVDIFSYSNELPYRIEFFGDHIESIRTFETENQLSIEQINALTIVPNIQSKLINTQTVSFLNYIDKHANIWIKDVQFTLDIIQAGYPKSIEIFEGFSTEDKNLHPEFLDPQYVFQNTESIESAFEKFNLIESQKQKFNYLNQGNNWIRRIEQHYQYINNNRKILNKDYVILGLEVIKFNLENKKRLKEIYNEYYCEEFVKNLLSKLYEKEIKIIKSQIS